MLRALRPSHFRHSDPAIRLIALHSVGRPGSMLPWKRFCWLALPRTAQQLRMKLLIIMLVLAGLGGGGYFYYKNGPGRNGASQPTGRPTTATAEQRDI